MLKKSELTSRHRLFLIKTAACFSGLLLASVLLAPKAQMQDEPVVTVNNTAVVVNGNYRPEPPKSILRGRVYYEDTGRAVKRTSIMLMGKEGAREVSGFTDNNGVFEIKNVSAGTYYAFVNAPGVVSPIAFADLSKSMREGFDDAVEGFPPIVVDGGGIMNVEIPARRGGAVSGRIMYSDGDPAIGVKVEIMRKVKDKFVSIVPGFSSIFSMMGGGGGFQTDDRGVYRFSGLPSGEYIVKVTENVSHSDGRGRGYSPFETMFGTSSFLTIFYQDALDTEKAQKINVNAGQELPEINIYIPDRDLYAVEGRVINAKDKQPVKNVSISLKKKGENDVSLFSDFGKRPQSGSSDEQGNWSFKELPKGTYTMTIEPANYPYEYDEDGYAGNLNSNRATNTPPKPKLAKKTQEITIENKSLSEIVIELGYGATVSGTVRTENNEPMPNSITITASQEDSEASSSATVYNYSQQAPYAANISRNAGPPKPNHDFKIEAVAAGKNFLWTTSENKDFYVKSAVFNGVDLLTNPLELKEGEMLRNVQFVISKNVGTLKGTVLDDSKQPAKRIQIVLVPVEPAKRKNPNFRRSAFSGESGEFEIKAAPIEYAVIFAGKDFQEKTGEEENRWLEEAVKNAPKVTLKSNETEKISLTLPK